MREGTQEVGASRRQSAGGNARGRPSLTSSYIDNDDTLNELLFDMIYTTI